MSKVIEDNWTIDLRGFAKAQDDNECVKEDNMGRKTRLKESLEFEVVKDKEGSTEDWILDVYEEPENKGG